jgi:FAD/FMN-containing dehydrogenase
MNEPVEERVMTGTSEFTLPADLCGGALHRPGDPGYDEARMPWNVAVDLRPAAVAHPSCVDELAAAVSAARAAGLRIAVQGTGHAAGALGDLSDALLIKTSGMTGVQVDAANAQVRVQAGALWADAVEAAAAHGLTVLHGSSPDVGVVGYSLGGGLGWYARALGLQTHQITGATVVTTGGEVVRVDEHSHPELLWGLRGGGGNFVVVAELEFRAYRFTDAYAGMLVWDWNRSDEVVRRWVAWSADAPDAVTTSLRLLQLPPIPDIPEPFRGRKLVVIDGAVLAEDAKAEQILAPLRELGPEMDTFARVPTDQLVRLHMDPEGPTPAVTGHSLLTGLPTDAVDAFLAAAGPASQSQVMVAELRQLGGVLARGSETPSALSGFTAPYALFAVSVAPTPEIAAFLRAQCDDIVAAMTPWAGGQYLNFAEFAVDPADGFPAEHWDRLRALRFAWDPDEALVASHRIPAARPHWLG